MTVRDIINVLETVAPPSLQESYDNAGLLAGNPSIACSGVLVSLDLTTAVVAEAQARNCNLIVSHHPLIFKGLKRISEEDPVGAALVRCLKNDIAIYAIHTNLDHVAQGVNGRIAQVLGLVNSRVLAPLGGRLRKLVVFVPEAYRVPLLEALWAAGAGRIGRYDECSFAVPGTGTFRAGEGANPFVGAIGSRHNEAEYRVEVIYPDYAERAILEAMRRAHPYEEVAYDLVPLQNEHQGLGAGLIGQLPEPMNEKAFLQRVRDRFGIPVIRHTAFRDRDIRTVAVCGGAGSFLVSKALSAGADAFLTADLKYHEFFLPPGRLLLADIGHYESEQFTSDLLVDLLKEKFPTFAVLKTGLETNPVHYFYT